MADLLTYALTVDAPVDTDVVTRELSVVVNGVTTQTSEFDGTAVDLGTITVPQDASVELSLVDVDDAGNRSEPAYVIFNAVDTLPPAQPGAFNVTLVAETPEENGGGEDVVN